MKTFFKTIFALVIMVILLGIITFLIDRTRVAANKKPLLAIEVMQLKEGGTKIYYGIGYKIIAYNKLNGYNKSHIGSYWLKYDEKLGEESELAELTRKNIENMNNKKQKDVVEFTQKNIINRAKFFTFLDMVEQKSIENMN